MRGFNVPTVDDDLPHWDTLAGTDWPTLLIGNGISINLWSRFSYASLYEEAVLDPEAEDVFRGLDTTNFETALEAVHHARLVADALNGDTGDIDDLYAGIRDGLFKAVNDAHLPWGSVPSSTEALIAEYLNGRKRVFTTNYDLVVYWAHQQNAMHVNLVDFFWGTGYTFDPNNTGIWSSGSTPVYYLHGAVHLWQDDYGDNGKWTNADTGNLLLVLQQYSVDKSKRPLFISEGTSKAKVRTIQRSPYLSHCLDALSEDDQNTVIVGHSLSSQDQHIVDALNEGPKRRVAVAIYPSGNSAHVIAEKVRIAEGLQRHTVHFFDSKTHLLGEPGLNIG